MFFSKKYRNVFLIFIIVFSVYYPVNHYGIFDLDDNILISRGNDYNNFDQLTHLFYLNPAGKYYRPLLETITYFESKLYGHQASGYHLTNLLAHLLNSIFLYFITLKLYKKSQKKELFSLITALLFALHPLNTESVVWISGRSDVFATFFILIAYYYYLSQKQSRFILVPIAILLGLMCKESAFAIFPVIIISECWFIQQNNLKQKLTSLLKWSAILAVPLVIYLILRTGLNHPITSPAAWPESNNSINSFPRVLTALSAIGFYIKKMFIPWPLIFGIMEINTNLYLFIFIIFVTFNVFLVVKKQYKFSAALILIVLTFFPALIISTGKIAWSPFADRYLYFTLCLWSTGFVYLLNGLFKKYERISLKPEYIFILILCIFATSTVSRVHTWKNSHALYKDALQYSPFNGKLLYKCGESSTVKEEKIQYYKKSVSVSKKSDWANYSYMALARYEQINKNNKKVIEYIEAALEISQTYSHYLDAANIILSLKSQDHSEIIRFREIALKYYEAALSQKKTAYALYKKGQLKMKLAMYTDAAKTFTEIIKLFPESTYKKNAETVIKRLKRKKLVNNFE